MLRSEMFPSPILFALTWFLFSLTGDVYIQPTQDTKNPVIYGVFSVSGLVYYNRCCMCTTPVTGSVLRFKIFQIGFSVHYFEGYIFLTFVSISSFTFSSQRCLQRLSSLCLLHGRHPHGLQRTLRPQGGSQLPVGGLHWEDPLPSTWHGEF